MDRRTFFKTTAALGLGVGLAASAPAGSAQAASASPLMVAKYKLVVPEIFAPLADAPSYSPAVVIGSGFGGAVTALRLAKAGIKTTVLERGSRWPFPSTSRKIFANDAVPDGRALWRRTKFTGLSGLPVVTDYFGGVLDVVELDGIQIWQGAGVGGGSLVYTGVHLVPERKYFDSVFAGTGVGFDEMQPWYAKAAAMLGASTMPDDIYNSNAYAHSRVWDAQVKKAGYTPALINGVWDWDIMRKEVRGAVRRSATISESNFGNANGVKRGLALNYLKDAESTGKATVYPGHEVLSIGYDAASRRYQIQLNKVSPTGAVLSRRTISCDRLFLAAGSPTSTKLLLAAKASGQLHNLNEFVGAGWGANGDAAVVRSWTGTGGLTQGAASRSRISDVVDGMPITLENWFVPGVPVDLGIIGSLGMTLDDRRATFTLKSDGKLQLTWPTPTDSLNALLKVNNAIAEANNVPAGAWPFAKSANEFFTAHPLGGAVLGKVTDTNGRVKGHPGLYVVDSATIPGNTGAVNPVLTITALAERNIAAIIANGG